MTGPGIKLNNLFNLEYPQSVGVYATYEEAQRAVDHLSDAKFPVQNLAIVGTDLKSIERVLGRRNWGTVLGSGVQSGISTGLMVTLLLWLFLPSTDFLALLATALGIGILIGVVMAALGYWMSQGKRDFTSVSQTVATRYEVLCEHKVAAQARDMLAQMPGARAAQFDPRNAPPPAGYPQGPGYPQGAYPSAYPQAAYPPGYPQGTYPPASGQYPAAPPAPPAPTAPAEESGFARPAGSGGEDAGSQERPAP